MPWKITWREYRSWKSMALFIIGVWCPGVVLRACGGSECNDALNCCHRTKEAIGEGERASAEGARDFAAFSRRLSRMFALDCGLPAAPAHPACHAQSTPTPPASNATQPA